MKLFGLMALTPILVACTSSFIAVDSYNNASYQPPLSGQKAVITGNLQPNQSRFVANNVIYITAINGDTVLNNDVSNPSSTWNNVYPISAGKNTITAAYRSGGFSVVPTSMVFDAQNDHTYQLQFASNINTEVYSTINYIDFWIADRATGRPVSDIVRTETATEFKLPFVSSDSKKFN